MLFLRRRRLGLRNAAAPRVVKAPPIASRVLLGLLCLGLVTGTALLALTPHRSSLATVLAVINPGLLVATFWLLAGLTMLAYWWPRRRQPRPFGLVAGSAASAVAVVLGMSSYWGCGSGGTPIWSPLFDTLTLFVGNVPEGFADPAGCVNSMPPALEIARLAALGTSLSAALAAVLSLFRDQHDRLRIRFARHAIVVTGIDQDTLSYVTAIAAQSRQPVVVIEPTIDDGPLRALRSAGVSVLRGRLRDSGVTTALAKTIARAEAAYFLGASPEQNIDHAEAVVSEFERADGVADRPPLRVVVRIDDAWLAEGWRRDQVGARPHAVFDTVGTQQVTAREIVHDLTGRGIDHLLILGSAGKAMALLEEVTQWCREQAAIEKPVSLQVTLIDSEADAALQLYRSRQRLHPVADGLNLSTLPAAPTSEAVSKAAADKSDLVRTATVECRGASPETMQFAQRMSSELAPAAVYYEDGFTKGVGRRPIAGGMIGYGPTMMAGDWVPEDAWVRIARYLHERYVASQRAQGSDGTLTPWEELEPFYRASNYRAVTNAMRLATHAGRTWTQTKTTVPAPLAPDEIMELAEMEHEDWRRYYQQHGWKKGAQRDRRRLRHPMLVDWENLEEDGKRRTIASLNDSLELLRLLGYSPAVKPGPLNESNARRFARSGDVIARRLAVDTTWTTHSGDVMTAAAGDWLLRETDDGAPWSITNTAFHATYQHVRDDRWRRTGQVWARRAQPPETAATTEGSVTAREGDWLVQDDAGAQWMVPAERFARFYTPIPGRPSAQ